MPNPRSTALFPCALLPLLLAASGAARAGDEPPARDFQATVSAFPAPSEAAGFDARGRVEVDGKAVGRFRLAAAVAPGEGAARWQLVEERETRFEDARLTAHARVVADAALQPVSGVLEEEDEFGDRLRHEWKAEEGGYRVETRSESRSPMGRSAAREGPCLTTLAALVLFARLAPAGSATYETTLFHPDWNYLEAERPFVAARLVLEAPPGGDVEGAVLRLTAAQERAVVEVVMEAGTRKLERLTLRQKDRPTLVLIPGSGETAPSEEDLFAAPSPTPRGCAARVALAFATVDAALFEAVIHWPTLREAMRSSIRGEVSDDAFRRSILDQFRKQGEGREAQPAADARAFLEQEAGRFEVEAQGEDGAVVTLSEAWGRMRLTVRRVEAAWYLARLPGR